MRKLKDIKEQTGTMRKLSNLLDSKKVYGVYYTNCFMSERYLSRSHLDVKELDVKNNEIRMTIPTRVEAQGIRELETTLGMLVEYKIGDIPNITTEAEEGSPHGDIIPVADDIVSVNEHLHNIDLYLIVEEPEITYKEFSIAGEKFTLVELHHIIDPSDDVASQVEQTITILFGEVGNLYFLSHFHNKNLTSRDTKMIMDLIVDENITGKAITSISVASKSTSIHTYLYPLTSLIGSFKNVSNTIIFSTDTGLVRLEEEDLNKYKMECVPINSEGHYLIKLEGKNESIHISFD